MNFIFACFLTYSETCVHFKCGLIIIIIIIIIILFFLRGGEVGGCVFSSTLINRIPGCKQAQGLAVRSPLMSE